MLLYVSMGRRKCGGISINYSGINSCQERKLTENTRLGGSYTEKVCTAGHGSTAQVQFVQGGTVGKNAANCLGGYASMLHSAMRQPLVVSKKQKTKNNNLRPREHTCVTQGKQVLSKWYCQRKITWPMPHATYQPTQAAHTDACHATSDKPPATHHMPRRRHMPPGLQHATPAKCYMSRNCL